MRKILGLLFISLWLFADGPVIKTGQTTVYQIGDDRAIFSFTTKQE